jgi:hypothetical protein
MHAKVRLIGPDPQARSSEDGLPAAPSVRTAENTLAEFVMLEQAPPRPWPKDVLADPELALGDACPAAMRGIGWWPALDVSPPLGLLETHGDAIVTLDPSTRTATTSRAVIPATSESLTAYYVDLEIALHLQIKRDTERAILAYAPDWKQRNALARSAELLEILVGGGVLTPGGELDRSALHAMRQRINAYRQASNGAEASVTAALGDEAAMRAAVAVDWSAVK